jgi:hypothetical protein
VLRLQHEAAIGRIHPASSNVLKEEAASGIAALDGVGRPLADISAMEEILLKLFFGDEIMGLVTMLGEDAYCSDVVCLRSFGFAVQLQGFDELLVPVSHDHVLLVK